MSAGERGAVSCLLRFAMSSSPSVVLAEAKLEDRSRVPCPETTGRRGWHGTWAGASQAPVSSPGAQLVKAKWLLMPLSPSPSRERPPAHHQHGNVLTVPAAAERLRATVSWLHSGMAEGSSGGGLGAEGMCSPLWGPVLVGLTKG